MPEFTAGPSWSSIAVADDEVLEAGRQALAIQVRRAPPCTRARRRCTARAARARGRRSGRCRGTAPRDRGRGRSARSGSRRCRRRWRRAPRAASRRAHAAMSGSSTEYGSRSRSASPVPLASPRDQRLEQQLRRACRGAARPPRSSPAVAADGARAGLRAATAALMSALRSRRRPSCRARLIRTRCGGRQRVPDCVDGAGRQLQHASGAAPRQADAPRLQVRDAVDDDAAVVERDHVDGEAHPAGVHATARHDPEPLAGLEPVALEQPDGARRSRRGHRRRDRRSPFPYRRCAQSAPSPQNPSEPEPSQSLLNRVGSDSLLHVARSSGTAPGRT